MYLRLTLLKQEWHTPIAMITDFDCWKEEHCSANEIMKVMKENNVKAQVLISIIVELYSNNRIIPTKENNEVVIMTPESAQSDEHKKLLKVLLS